VRLTLLGRSRWGPLLLISLVATACGDGQRQYPDVPTRPECIAPAKPGGGFDLTCRIVSESIRDAGLLEAPMVVSYKPGGIGAVAMAHMMTTRRRDPNVIVAFSTGSLLNIAQGKFGPGVEFSRIRWLAAAGVDYGALVVSADSDFADLSELMSILRTDPNRVVFGAGGTIGSQDWVKAALLFRHAGRDPKDMRYVAFEGGGDATAALLGRHIDVMPGDVSEVKGLLGTNTVRVLAVLSAERLPGVFGALPTAAEQGVEIAWPIFRGYYAAPDINDAQYRWWVDLFAQLVAAPEFQEVRQAKGLLPLDLVGEEFSSYVTQQAGRYEQLARDFRLVR
jgi:putative tricarboxylic transport membrane protein